MDTYDVYVLMEHDPSLQSLIGRGHRFALAATAGSDAEARASASSIREMPTPASSLLNPASAMGFLTWVRFAGRHYGMVIVVCPAETGSIVQGLLKHSSAVVQMAGGSGEMNADAERLGDMLWPLVGTQYSAIEEFRLLIAELREKCPWDRRQTHTSLLDSLLEESYEVALAIEKGSTENLEEELGDLLLQVFIQSEVSREEDGFDICDVIHVVDDKLTFRHPHVFGDVSAASSEEVLENWQKLKLMEGRKKHFVDSAKLLSTIENALLAQETARGEGFDFDLVDQAYGKLLEESRELGDELSAEPRNDGTLAMELGDVLFSAINVARLAGINPVKALRHSSDKFRDRYAHVRAYAEEQKIDISTASQDELELLWQRAKNAKSQTS